MGTRPREEGHRTLTFDDIPLARTASELHDLSIARPNGIEWYIKCKAPSPGGRTPKVYDTRPCTEFVCKAYFDEAKAPFRDVCVIFNGLDETPHNLNEHELFGFYDALGKTLASHGMMAILLPSPFHLNRSLVYKNVKTANALKKKLGHRFVDLTQPSNAMIHAPQNLYVNHYQSFRELVSLCRDITPHAFGRKTARKLATICAKKHLIADSAANFLRDKIDRGARLSIIGYSMGGSRVLTAFCFAWEMAVECDEEPIFASCVSINAGGSFSSMSVPAWVDKSRWSTMVRRLNLETFSEVLSKEFPEEVELFDQYSKTIRDVTLGNALKIRQLEESDSEFTRRLLFILGGGDEIMKLNSLQRITPPGGLNIFHVAGVGHMFRHGEWGTHLGSMLVHVGNFVAASSKEAGKLSSQEIVDFLSLVDWRFRILPFDSRHMYAENREHSDIGAAIDFLDDVDRWALLRLILDPVDNETEILSRRQRPGKRSGVRSTETLANQAVNFVKFRLLTELKTRIEAGDCHPGLYGQARRSLLLGWIISNNKVLVRHWESLVQKDRNNKRFGDAMVDLGIVPRAMIDQSIKKQRSLLEAVRGKMARAFSLDCRSHGFAVEG